ncbi:MAG: tripartite tricarboxylate transporter substrate binding protein [Pseudomonas sp.]
MKSLRLLLAACAMTTLAAAGPGAAFAQDYPSRPITLVVGYPPGGGADAIGRLVAQKLGEALNASVVVDNRPGFSGNIGAQYAARSAPDGYTLLVAPWTTYAINSILYGKARVGYDLAKDFAPVTVIGYQPMVLMVNPDVPVHSVSELVAYARSMPGRLSFGSTGPGSLEHIAGEMFNRATGAAMVHVPYRGSGPAMTDLMGGQIEVYFATAPTVVANLGSGRIRPLMVTTPERNVALPNLPTPKEAGVDNFEVRSSYGLLAPAKTPEAIVRQLNEAMVKALGAAEVKARFRGLGIDAASSAPRELAARIDADFAKWERVIKDQNIKTEN